MKLYADLPFVRARQVAFDVAVVLWTVVWIRLGRGLYDAVDRLRVAGDATARAGGGLADRMRGIAAIVDGVPLVGGALRQPFLGAADAGRTLQAAGASSSDAVHTVALWLGVLIAVLPIVWLLARYVPGRVAWVRDATAVAGAPLDAAAIDLLACRASLNHPLRTTMPVAGDRAALAQLEIARLGLRR